MNKSKLMVICLIMWVIMICIAILVFSSCRVNASEYNVETDIYNTTTLSFEDAGKFRRCVEYCMTDPDYYYVSSCMNDEKCSSCLDECYETYKPNLILMEMVFEDINPNACFITSLN